MSPSTGVTGFAATVASNSQCKGPAQHLHPKAANPYPHVAVAPVIGVSEISKKRRVAAALRTVAAPAGRGPWVEKLEMLERDLSAQLCRTELTGSSRKRIDAIVCAFRLALARRLKLTTNRHEPTSRLLLERPHQACCLQLLTPLGHSRQIPPDRLAVRRHSWVYGKQFAPPKNSQVLPRAASVYVSIRAVCPSFSSRLRRTPVS